MAKYVVSYSLIDGKTPSFIQDGGYYENKSKAITAYVGVTDNIVDINSVLQENCFTFSTEEDLASYFSTFFSLDPIIDRGQEVAPQTAEEAASFIFSKV